MEKKNFEQPIQLVCLGSLEFRVDKPQQLAGRRKDDCVSVSVRVEKGNISIQLGWCQKHLCVRRLTKFGRRASFQVSSVVSTLGSHTNRLTSRW